MDTGIQVDKDIVKTNVKNLLRSTFVDVFSYSGLIVIANDWLNLNMLSTNSLKAQLIKKEPFYRD